MQATRSDTICAIATAPGRSGVGIVRISGPDTAAISREVIGHLPQPRRADFRSFLGADGSAIDFGLALFFSAPASFTGEDILELQGHGGPQVLNAVLARVIELGARLANPGEFSERAFLNDKIDLVQAEAIADLIEAGSIQAMRSALRTLQGDFSHQINTLVEQITALRVQVEAAIDFSDEDIDVMDQYGVAKSLKAVQQALGHILSTAEQGSLLKEGIQIVLAGKPNAGKSSLLNALCGQETAIVTEIPGTTRDLLRQEINIDGLPVHITDTAGLRTSADRIEQEGVKRARQALSNADQILLIVDGAEGQQNVETLLAPLGLESVAAEQRQAILARTTLVINKIDLLARSNPEQSSTAYQGHTLTVIQISAKTGLGLDLLTTQLKDLAGYQQSSEGVFVARKRHLIALAAAQDYLVSAVKGVSEHLHLELIAEDLRLAQEELGRITGRVSSDDLLGEIFANFCVGK